MRRITLLALFAAMLAGSAVADRTSMNAGFSVSLGLVPETVLPGVPVSFRVRLTNLSNVPADVPQDLRLEVEPLGGEKFCARTLDRDSHSPASTFGRWPREVLTLAGKETAEIIFPVDPTLVGPEWFRDPRLNRPGVYRLRLLLYPPKDEVTLNDPTSDGDSTANVGGPIISNSVVLTITEPQGEDAVVWQKMQKMAGAEGWNTTMLFGSGIAREVWINHPTSRYLAYVATVLHSRDSAETERALRAAIAVDPDSPQRDWVRTVLGAHYTRLAKEAAAVRNQDLDKAYQYAELARQEFKALLLEAKTAESRSNAEIGLARIPDRLQLKELHELTKKQQQK